MGRIWRRPRSTLTNIGMNAAIAATIWRPVSTLAPNIALKTGASATIGMTASAAIDRGADFPSIARQRGCEQRPAATPTTRADDQPDERVASR